MAERIADYCEAVLNVTEMCKTGLRCCVSKDAFAGAEHLVVLDRNSTRISLNNAPHRPPPPPSTTTTAATTTAAADTSASAAAPPPGSKQCRGECVSGLFALFCDDVDADAYCPGDDSSCCVTAPADGGQSGQQQQPPPPPPPPRPAQPPKQQSTKPSTAATTAAGPPLPKCPGFCLLNLMAAFCERPSVLVSYTSTCKRGSVCCDNTKAAAPSPAHQTQRPKPRPPAPTTTTVATPPAPPDGRPECPGSCIVPYLSFTCFSKSFVVVICPFLSLIIDIHENKVICKFSEFKNKKFIKGFVFVFRKRRNDGRVQMPKTGDAVLCFKNSNP